MDELFRGLVDKDRFQVDLAGKFARIPYGLQIFIRNQGKSRVWTRETTWVVVLNLLKSNDTAGLLFCQNQLSFLIPASTILLRFCVIRLAEPS